MPEAEEPEVQKRGQALAGPAQEICLLDRRLDLTRVDPQVWIFLALLVVAALLRLWDLGARAMHHDESVHAWYSWRFYTGEGLYQYEPAFHGPFLYQITALFFFLFGTSDAMARAPEALFGLLTVALCYPLRRWLGRWGWLIAAAVLTFSPAFVYFARFARHDALVVPLTLGTAIALFRYLEDRRPRDLTLAAVALAFAFASHELTFITLFIWLSFFGLAYLLDRQGDRLRSEGVIIAAFVLAVSILWLALLARMSEGGSPLQAVPLVLGMLALGYLLLSFLWSGRFLGQTSPVQEALGGLVRNPRPLLAALGIFGVIFGLLFTNFLTYPRGFVDGLVQGLRYWLGQQAVSRGDQPWFYYLILLPVYEPIALTAGAAGFGIVVAWARRHLGAQRTSQAAGEPSWPRLGPPFAIFLAYWALFSLLLYSWAGEKMPWLLLQVAQPLVLLAGLALDRFVAWVPWPTLWRSWDWSVPPLLLLLAAAVANTIRLAQGQTAHPLANQYTQLQALLAGIIALALLGLLIWRLYRAQAHHLGQSFAALGVLLFSLYTVRSTFLLNFYHGDTPREMLVYTQTAPDVPLVVRQIERLSIDETRWVRPVTDPAGGHGLDVAIDNSLDAGLEWPFNWYLREFIRAGSLTYFNGTQGPPPDVDVLLILATNEPALRPYLQADYTGMRLKHRWWFPEGETYRRWTLLRDEQTEWGYQSMPWLKPKTYSPQGVAHLWGYLMYRDLPYALGSQDFYLYLRNDLLPVGPTAAEKDPYLEKLTTRRATRILGSVGSGPGQLYLPRGIALDEAGNLYVADSANHRVVRFDPLGQSISWGGPCILDPANPAEACLGQFNEPWGVAVDGHGRVYVADTWNHRIQVFDTNGNFLGQWGEGRLVDADTDARGRAGTTMAFFGPRGLATDRQGHIYVTDTGNERVMVYAVQEDETGAVRAEFLYQWGRTGFEPGDFSEPVGIAVDESGRVYVADTWNRRVQVFAPGGDGTVYPEPVVTWEVTGWESDSRDNKPFLAVSPGGQVYFTFPDRHYVACTDGTGKILAVWGGFGSDSASFNVPTGVAVDETGQVYVSDAGNGRVMTFTVP